MEITINSVFPPQQLSKLNQAIDDCSSAIKLDDTYIKAYLRRAQWYAMHLIWAFSPVLVFWARFEWLYVACSYMDTEQYEEAVRDYEKVYQTEKTSGKL